MRNALDEDHGADQFDGGERCHECASRGRSRTYGNGLVGTSPIAAERDSHAEDQKK